MSIVFYLNIILVIIYINLQLYKANIYVFAIYLYMIRSLWLYNIIAPWC